MEGILNLVAALPQLFHEIEVLLVLILVAVFIVALQNSLLEFLYPFLCGLVEALLHGGLQGLLYHMCHLVGTLLLPQQDLQPDDLLFQIVLLHVADVLLPAEQQVLVRILILNLRGQLLHLFFLALDYGLLLLDNCLLLRQLLFVAVDQTVRMHVVTFQPDDRHGILLHLFLQGPVLAEIFGQRHIFINELEGLGFHDSSAASLYFPWFLIIIIGIVVQKVYQRFYIIRRVLKRI